MYTRLTQIVIMTMFMHGHWTMSIAQRPLDKWQTENLNLVWNCTLTISSLSDTPESLQSQRDFKQSRFIYLKNGV